jgi:hypothetical protein
MLCFKIGNFKEIMQSEAECLVNMTSCTGRFENSICNRYYDYFPDYAFWYYDECLRNKIKIGECYLYSISGKNIKSRYILSLPYKRNWHSTMWANHVVTCIKNLSAMVKTMQFESVALPAVGFKSGGKIWEKIRESYNYLDIKGVDVFIFAGKKLK